MTEKDLIWEALRTIESSKTPYIDLRETIWSKFCEKKQLHLRRLLLVSKLIGLEANKQWNFELTADGIRAKKRYFNKRGLLRIWYTEFFKGLVTILIAASATAILTILAEWVKDKYLSKPPSQTIVLKQIRQPNIPYFAIDSGKTTVKK